MAREGGPKASPGGWWAIQGDPRSNNFPALSKFKRLSRFSIGVSRALRRVTPNGHHPWSLHQGSAECREKVFGVASGVDGWGPGHM